MAEEKTKKGDLGFKYERKRIKKDKKLPPLCTDYKPEEGWDSCEKAKFCKNATYSWGNCYGGTKSSEIEHRKKYFAYKVSK